MDKNKVIVGISGSYIIDNGGMFPGYKRVAKNVDVLILSGGQDINPLLWGEEPSSKLGEFQDTFWSSYYCFRNYS